MGRRRWRRWWGGWRVIDQIGALGDCSLRERAVAERRKLRTTERRLADSVGNPEVEEKRLGMLPIHASKGALAQSARVDLNITSAMVTLSPIPKSFEMEVS